MLKSKANILVITGHDTGRHFGCYGIENVHTPCIDALASGGVLFSNYFAASSVCAPSRGAMMTGRYPQSNGLMEMPKSANVGRSLFPWDWSYNEGEQHVSHLLRDAGYHTALIGFQHEAYHSETLGFVSKHAEMIPWTVRHPAERVSEAAVAFLKTRIHGQEPFYAQVGFFESHRPFDFGGVEPDDNAGVYIPPYLAPNEFNVNELAHLQGAVKKLDTAVGEILEALRETGLEENTVVVFTVDHGIEFPRAKKFLYDPGIEVAFMMRWPQGGIVGGQRCDWLLSHVDFLPTLLDLVGVPVPEQVQGVSFSGAFESGEAKPARDAVFGIFHPLGIRCVRTKRYKLIRNFEFRMLLQVPADAERPRNQKAKCPAVQFFDLEKDPNEFENRVEDPEYADAVAALDDCLWSWLEDVDDPILMGPAPTPYYHEAMADYRHRSQKK